MSILTQDFIFSAIASERIGIEYPIDFDEIFEIYGYSFKRHAKRYILKFAETYVQYGSPHSGQINIIHIENDKIQLSVTGLKMSLARANTEIGFSYLLYLIQVEESYRAQLERQLQASPRESDNTRYSITFWKVHQDSGIKDPYYVRDVIVDNYDHKIVNQIVCVTRLTYEDLLENFRSLDGADISELPLEKRRKFHKTEGKKNRREPQSDNEQLSFF